MNDHDLIREFTATRSEQAFRRLVDRYCDLVFSVASRVTRDPDLARDVSQQVFCKLASKPNSVPARVPVAAWLHRTCRSLAVDLVRSEDARRKRETALSHPSAMHSETTPDWSRLEPVIDSLIDELPELDRRAVVLRFYEKRSHGAIGAALGKKLDGDDRLVYSLHGDGELQEGQIWEAAMFAAHNKVDNLISTIDVNGQQIDGPTDRVLGLGDLKAKWTSFGWDVMEMEGNDLQKVVDGLAEAKSRAGKGKPVMILMKTNMGHGVDFMMGSHHWHGVAPNDEQLSKALGQLELTMGDY